MKTTLFIIACSIAQFSIAQIFPYNNTIQNQSLQNSSIGGFNAIYGTTTTGQTTSGCFTSGYSNIIKYNTGSQKQVSGTTHILGANSIAGGQSSFAIGSRVVAGTNDFTTSGTALNVFKNNAFALGRDITVYADNAFAIGSGLYSTNHTSDLINETNNSLIIGFNSTDKLRPTFFVGANVSTSPYDDYGSVGIGTNNTKGHTLAVRGDIIAEKIQVAIFTNWPDYVFKSTYKLLPLLDLEKEIISLGHLPDVPEASAVEKNGYDLAKMDAILLQKIEELTLYIIELKKENNKLREVISK